MLQRNYIVVFFLINKAIISLYISPSNYLWCQFWKIWLRRFLKNSNWPELPQKQQIIGFIWLDYWQYFFQFTRLKGAAKVFTSQFVNINPLVTQEEWIEGMKIHKSRKNNIQRNTNQGFSIKKSQLPAVLIHLFYFIFRLGAERKQEFRW